MPRARCFWIKKPAITSGTMASTATAGTLYGVQAALAVLAMVPLVIAGFLIQKHLARGMTFGAVKR